MSIEHGKEFRGGCADRPSGTDALQCTGRPQLLALPQRHDAVVDRGDLSPAQRRISLEFRADRRDHAHLSGLRLPFAAHHRHLHRQASQALFAQRRHVLHAGRHRHAGLCAELRQRAGGGRTDRRGVRDLSSGILAHRAPGLGRPSWPGAIDFSGRRQCRLRHGTVAGRLDHHSARAAQPGLVRDRRPARHCGAGAGRRLVQAPAHRSAQDRASFRCDRSGIAARECAGRSPCWCC